MQKSKAYLGTLELLSEPTVTVSLPTTIRLRYTAGIYGVDENGSLRLAWRTVSDFEQPQFTDPAGFGYTTISTSAHACIEAARSMYQRPFHNSIHLRVRDGNICLGDTVDIVLGDPSQGSPGIRTQSFAETGHEFKLMVDPFNINIYQELPESVKIQVRHGQVNEINLLLPSIIEAGKEFSCTVRILDEWGNPCKDFCGSIAIQNQDGTRFIETVDFTPEDGGFKKVEGNLIEKPGEYSIFAQCGEYGLSCWSNPCVCTEKEPAYHLFWGDMHGQTDITIGTGSLDEYYSFAKGPGALDFTGWRGNDFEIDHKGWDEVRKKTREYHEEGSFLVYLGYEWSGNHSGGGDHNVWFLHDEEHFYPSSHWTVNADYAEDDRWDRYPVNRMFDEYRGRKDVMIIPHIGGRPGNLDYCTTDVIHNIEIHSHHGTFEWFAKDAMKKNLKVGFVASGDDHTCRPGLSYPLQNTGQEANAFDTKSGLVAVYAKELTKEAIWEALQARRCYAVTFNRMLLDVRIGNAVMGEETIISGLPQLKITAIGQCPIDHIEIYRGDKLVCEKYNYILPDAAEDNPVESQKVLPGTRHQRKKIKILWSGVRSIGRKKLCVWDGHIFLERGKIIRAEEIAFDTFQQGITYQSNQQISWKSSTSGDYDGLMLELDYQEGAVLSFYSKPIHLEIPLAGLSLVPRRYDAGGVNLKVEVSLAGEHPQKDSFQKDNPQMDNSQKDNSQKDSPQKDNSQMNTFQKDNSSCRESANKFCMEWNEEDPSVKSGAYWVKAVQDNGQMAFSSPIFVTIN